MCPSDAPDPKPATPYLPDLLARAAHIVVEGFAAELRQVGVSLPVWRVLAALSATSGPTVSALADACLLQQPTMTKLLDRVVRDGLVTRAPDPRDRRVVRVALTAQGETKAAELRTLAGRYEARVLARYPQADSLRGALQDIITGPRRAGDMQGGG